MNVHEIGYILYGIGMLKIVGVKLQLVMYRMQLVFDVCPSNQLLVAGHFIVKPVVDNV